MRTSLMPTSGRGTSASSRPGPACGFTRASMAAPYPFRRPSAPSGRAQRRCRCGRSRPCRRAGTAGCQARPNRIARATGPSPRRPDDPSRGHLLVHRRPITPAVTVLRSAGVRAHEANTMPKAQVPPPPPPIGGRRAPTFQEEVLAIDPRRLPPGDLHPVRHVRRVVPVGAGHGPHASPDLRAHPGRSA